MFAVAPAMAAPGEILVNGTSTGITVPGFLFEPEVPFTSLKNVPTWNELEQLLDNPYAVTHDPTTPGNDQGFPSYRATGITRRPGFGVTLPAFLVHPLNYNPTTGEEMRLLNPRYPGGTFNVTDQLVEGPPGTFTWTRRPATISPGSARVEPGSTAIDYNNPIAPDTPACVITTETIPPEGSTLCGGDPGEPGYFGFGVLRPIRNYSTPAVPLAGATPANPGNPAAPLPANARLFDPQRGFIQARNPLTGAGGLRKPSLRVPAVGGRPNNPNYLINTDPNNVTASSENDYIRDRTLATVLGKALFWDMQVGSDGVQSCGTCHFNGTGTDTRTRNQLNPNHINGNDITLQLGDAPSSTQPGSQAANYTLTTRDFPLHRLSNPDVAGDPACTTPLLASVNAGVLENNFPGGVTGLPVCDASNLLSDVNDVVSSMGVVFSPFTDIAPIGAFQPAANGVRAVMPDIRTAGALDPLPVFQGFRRVEPRNTPTMQAAGFNFDNFWDGRARHDFNGGSVFGAADPQNHVFVGPVNGGLTATRQIIRFASIASLATGPGLSEFEMSFAGRNWAKIGKKLLQGRPTGGPVNANRVVPLANQLVATDDSVLGPYSNRGGSACASLLPRERSIPAGSIGPNTPGLCITYPALIERAFYPALWRNTSSHVNGCYTDGRSPQCAGTPAIPILDANGTVTEANTADPFDAYVLASAAGSVNRTDTNQFTQMEANFSLFWGLSINAWVQILVPDHTPFDQLLDANPGAFATLGEPGEPGLVQGMLMCSQTSVPGFDPHYCFTEVGNFKRDATVQALRDPTGEGGAGGHFVPSGGTRQSGQPDPLLGFDIFFASNLSLKNPNFRTGRCGECHAIPTLTDHTMPFTSKINLMDAVAEFSAPGVELILEPLARLRVISGFLLESEINENGQDAVERRIVNQSLVPNPVDGLAYPGATAAGIPGFGPWTGADSAFLDNGMYNLGVRPITEDLGRGANDAFGWPMSLAALMMKNLAGPAFEPGNPMATFDPELGSTGGLFEETAQDQQINPGFEGEPANPLLPPYLAAFANNITVGDFPPEMDEAGGAIGGMVNTLTDVAMIEGFLDTLGPFNPANVAAEVLNVGGGAMMGTWPVVNRVGRMGSFKAPQLRNVELTGPYFHNGGKLTLRQVVDFYTRGGDFPVTNAAHRDFNLVNMNIEVQSNLTEEEKVALVDFLLELTDERNRFDRAPFDHPQVIIPVDGLAPDSTGGRTALLADPRFLDIKAVGAAGRPVFDGTDHINTGPEPAFLNVTKARVSGADASPGSPTCDYIGGMVSHYCH
jgi:cytochrome c peroxidase